MRTVKSITLLAVIALFFGCSSDDNGSDSGPSNLELLFSGKWYQESSSSSTYTACEKQTSFDFMASNALEVEVFDVSSGSCQSLGTNNASYSLTNDVDLVLTITGWTISGTIQSIDSDELVVLSSGETVTFDRNPG